MPLVILSALLEKVCAGRSAFVFGQSWSASVLCEPIRRFASDLYISHHLTIRVYTCRAAGLNASFHNMANFRVTVCHLFFDRQVGSYLVERRVASGWHRPTCSGSDHHDLSNHVISWRSVSNDWSVRDDTVRCNRLNELNLFSTVDASGRVRSSHSILTNPGKSERATSRIKSQRATYPNKSSRADGISTERISLVRVMSFDVSARPAIVLTSTHRRVTSERTVRRITSIQLPSTHSTML